jgi:two-component system OmpR family sensor kinase
VLEVEDGGPGIPDELQDAVFERFYRAEGGVAWGSGLGLAIAKELARLMDGVVVLESRPGRTVFSLELRSESAPRVTSTRSRVFSRENASRSRT